MEITSFAPVTSLLWKYLEQQGIDPAPIYRNAGISPKDVLNPKKRLNINLVNKVWAESVKVLDDPVFGVKMVQNWHPSMMGALGYAWLVSSTLRRAMTRVDRYIHTVTEGLETELTETPRGLRLSFLTNDKLDIEPQQHTLIIAIVMHMCRFNYGNDLVATNIELARPEPENTTVIQDFFRTTVIFNADANSITIAHKDADSELVSGNKEIALMHDEILMKYLVTFKNGNIVEQTQTIILDNLPDGQVSDKLIASKLNLSVRTLQRRLKEHNTSFSKQLSKVRETAAKQYIKNPLNQMVDIAFLIGFSEQSAFSRAFKKWTGKTPVEYRAKLSS